MFTDKKLFLINYLDARYKKLSHNYCKSKSPSDHFKAEGIRGCLVALKNGKTVREAVDNGIYFLREFISLWHKQKKTKHKIDEYEEFIKVQMNCARTTFKEKRKLMNKKTKKVTEKQIEALREVLLGTTANVYQLCKAEFGHSPNEQIFIDLAKGPNGIFRCDECNMWLDKSEELAEGFESLCIDCLDQIDEKEEE